MSELYQISIIDIIALTFFVASWCAYALFSDSLSIGKRSLMSTMSQIRVQWFEEMQRRDNRMVDIQVVAVLNTNVGFFASAAVLIIGGLLAILGSGESARLVIEELPFAVKTSAFLWDIKLLTLVIIFVYAFFKFTWSLRQFNYLAVLIAATPDHHHYSNEHAQKLAAVASRAGDHFNKAMRAYYFGLAALSWFIQPFLFIFITIWVVIIVYRREYRSRIFALMEKFEKKQDT